MQQHFVDALENAQGRSEFVIVVVIDIRGFSRFSTRHESPDIAMFIKRFYLRLIKDYFSNATFVKPTGDGLLMTFIYDENSLKEMAQTVIDACLRALNDFQTLCQADPMINFKTPDAIGIGISRGTACCLFSGEETLDYSGHLLNLASRLNDLARPRGIVIDGAFLDSIIPDSCRAEFKTELVYVRSIAEEKPIPVFYLANSVKIPASALTPISGENWRSVLREIKYNELIKFPARFRISLPSRVRAADDIRVTIMAPNKRPTKLSTTLFFSFTDFEFDSGAIEDVVRLPTEKIRQSIGSQITAKAKITIRIDYIPKAIPSS